MIIFISKFIKTPGKCHLANVKTDVREALHLCSISATSGKGAVMVNQARLQLL
jgi:hypothetical protein